MAIEKRVEATQSIINLNKSDSAQIKGIAILLILFGHAGIFPNCAAGGVALFLIISGYGLAASYYQKKGINRFWQNKFASVYIPYLIAIVMQIVVLGFTSKTDILFSLLGIDFGHLIDGTMWYISFQFYWYLVFFLSVVLASRYTAERVRAGIIVAGCFFGSIICILLAKCGAWHEGVGAALYVLDFPIGILLFYFSRIKCSNKQMILFWLTIVLLSAMYFFKNYLRISNAVQYSLFALSIPGMIVGGLMLSGKPKQPWWAYIGKKAYAIYLVEGFFWYNLGRFFPQVSAAMAQSIVFISCSLIVGIAFGKYITEPMRDLFHKQ